MKSVKVIEIIAEELRMPQDASLADILAAMFIIDLGKEIEKLLIKVVTQDVLDKILDSFTPRS